MVVLATNLISAALPSGVQGIQGIQGPPGAGGGSSGQAIVLSIIFGR